MIFGKISKGGPVGRERYSRFTDDELVTHMTFWCIYRSPLMLGGNLPDNRELERRLFTNEEVLEVNQRGQDPRQLYKNEGKMVWVSKAAVGTRKSYYVALFNIGEKEQVVAVDFRQLGLKGKVMVHDCWKKADVGVFNKQYSRMVAAHGAALVRVVE